MPQLIIDVPDNVSRWLNELANAEPKSVEQVAAEQLNPSARESHSPERLLRAVRHAPHVDSADVDELRAAIKAGRLPVRDQVLDTNIVSDLMDLAPARSPGSNR